MIIRSSMWRCRERAHLFEQLQVEIEGERVIFDGREAVMLIEGRGGLVLGVHDEDHEADFLSDRLASPDRKAEETAPDALPVVTMIDTESPHPCSRRRVFGESSAVVFADPLEIDLSRAERIIAKDGSWLVLGNEDKGLRDSHCRILPGVAAKKTIDFTGPAVEAFSIVIAGQQLLKHGEQCRPPDSGHAAGQHRVHAVD